ncbi:MAG: hypothetical protein H6810_08485 [Phycisphaeraceae bacterium]|nr:MAG: hypothetical protein H6810_08485 [Phycisphaeraceae bacterium]
MRTKTLVISVVAAAALGGLGWTLTDRFYLREHDKIRQQSADLERVTEAFEAASKGLRDAKVALNDFAGTMLGSEQMVVEHRLRTLLSEMAEREGLSEIVVSNTRPRTEDSPAQGRGSGVNRTLRQMLGHQQDFEVMRARVQGTGTLDQVLATLAAAQGQPWIHRIEGFTIVPKGHEHPVYELKVDLATIYAPDLVDPAQADPLLESPSPAASARLASVIERAPFTLATPPVDTPPQPPVRIVNTPPPPPAPPYDKWRITGVLETLESGGSQVQVLLARTDTGELRTMRPGDALLGAKLESAGGESAHFTLDGRRVVVRAGQTLAQAATEESVNSESPPHPHG